MRGGGGGDERGGGVTEAMGLLPPAAAAQEGDETTVPFAEPEFTHGEAVAPAAGVTVRGEDLLLVLL